MGKMQQILDGGKVPFYAWPGGYALVYHMADGETLCAKCVEDNLDLILEAEAEGWDKQWIVESYDVYWEGPSLYCAHCNEQIESEYGDPDEEANND